MRATLLDQPFGAKRAGDWLRENLAKKSWTEFRAAAAFAKLSGIRHLTGYLRDFCQRRKATISIGVDQRGTSKEALHRLLTAMSGQPLFVFHHAHSATFHPKVYMFRNKESAVILLGSSNLTEGGLFTNYEASLSLELKRSDRYDSKLLAQFLAAFDSWTDPTSPTVRLLDKQLLERLASSGLVPTEAEIALDIKRKKAAAREPKIPASGNPIFGAPSLPPDVAPDFHPVVT